MKTIYYYFLKFELFFRILNKIYTYIVYTLDQNKLETPKQSKKFKNNCFQYFAAA